MQYLILLWLLVSFPAFAETSLWRVSKGDSELFIGGTIHVLSNGDYPLPIEFEQAYKQAKTIVFETDLIELAQPEIQQQFLQRLMYAEGKTLKDDVSEKTYKALVDYVVSTGLTIDTLNQFKPPMVMITLLMAELQRLGMANTGVDNYFNHKAVEDGKTLDELESVQVQLDVIANMGKGHEDEMILSAIAETRELASIMEEMKAAWRKGDIKQLEKIGLSPMNADFPDLYRLLLVERNNRWIPKIEAFLATPATEFVLVGALHLVGYEGLISKLRRLGYKVEFY
ncbi:MAG: TraB/GumN family protein [Methylococcaceae bacterium]|nr:TraB/GumN family protein [Methylococcaceae bacterium]